MDRKVQLNEQIKTLNGMIDREMPAVDIKSYRGAVLTAAHEAGVELVEAGDGSYSIKEEDES